MNYRVQVFHRSHLHRWIGGNKNSISIISCVFFIRFPPALSSLLFTFAFPLHSSVFISFLLISFIVLFSLSSLLSYSPLLSILLLNSLCIISFFFITVWWICGIVLLHSVRCIRSQELQSSLRCRIIR